MDNNEAEEVIVVPSPPKWQLALAIFVGVVIANNLVIYGLVGGNRPAFGASEQLGYELGTGIGLGLGLSFAMWLLLLRRASRRWTVACFAIVCLSAFLAMHYIPMRP